MSTAPHASHAAREPRVLVLSTSLHPQSRSRILAEHARVALAHRGTQVAWFDCRDVDLPYMDGHTAHGHDATQALQRALGEAFPIDGAGGALETVTEGQSGIFFKAQTTDSLVEAIRRFEQLTFDPVRVRKTVERFDVGPFVRHMRAFVNGEAPSEPAARATDRETA